MPYREPTLKAPVKRPRQIGAGVVVGLAAGAGVVAGLFYSQTPREVPRRPVAEISTGDIVRSDAAVWVAGLGPDGSQQVIAGPTRFVVSLSKRVEVASMRFGDDIAVATEVRDGWVFVTTGGDVARSDSFLGPLRPLGRVLPALAGEFARGLYLGSSGVTVQTTGGHLVLDVDGRLHHRADAGRPEARQLESGALRNQLNATGLRISAVYVSPRAH